MHNLLTDSLVLGVVTALGAYMYFLTPLIFPGGGTAVLLR